MVTYNYTVSQLFVDPTNDFQGIESVDSRLISTFPLNTYYDQKKHRIELYFYTLGGTFLQSDINYNKDSQQLSSAGAGKKGAEGLSIDPAADAVEYGYESGDVISVYHFLNNLFSDNKAGGLFFIESISDDRTEIRALSNQVTPSDIQRYVTSTKASLNNFAHFSEFYLNFEGDTMLTALNLDIDPISKGMAVVFKLYKPLPSEIEKNAQFTIEEKVIDSVTFQITSEVAEQAVNPLALREPNFNIEISTQNYNPTEYLDFTDLFSYPVSGSDYKLYALSNEKGIELSIDYSDFSSFIYFSSVYERLSNFEYKLGLIQGYENQRALKTGSRDYFDTQIRGIISNFDHYDRYLYFESGAYAWPKIETQPPYTNQSVSSVKNGTWYNNIFEEASSYDDTNSSILIGDIPAFLREDPDNAPYVAFTHMIGQHFDNIWVYSRAVTDRYNADNRLTFGISKDLIRESIESLGIHLYNSNFSFNDIFSSYISGSISGSNEVINTNVVATSGSVNSYLQPVATSDYEKEVYKRIYHNIPFLLKTKGTERGVRALINCFGIPDDILKISTYGGIKKEDTPFLGPLREVSSSLHKIRIDNSGSIVSGSTLSRYVSITDRDLIYSDDQNLIEIGFDISSETNEFIKQELSASYPNFNFDDYIGDPGLIFSSSYYDFNDLGYQITSGSSVYPPNTSQVFSKDPGAIIRLTRFFDERLFRMIKDFVPARTNLTTGVIVKDHILHRNKAKQVQLTGDEEVLSGSIDIAFISGSDGNSFGVSEIIPYTTNYEADWHSPLGIMERDVTDESPRYNGEFSGSLVVVSDGALTRDNPLVKQVEPIMLFSLTFITFTSPKALECGVNLTGRLY